MVPAVYAGVAVVFVVIVVAVAYGNQAPRLGVAEFAPAAQQAIESPPSTAGDPQGASTGGRRRASTTTSVAATAPPDAGAPSGPPTSLVGRGRNCYGSPARQTEDPQSPPCIPTVYEGDNGGATWKGVTSTEIAVGVTVPDSANVKMIISALFDYFNRKFEFYGRRVRPVFLPQVGVESPLAARGHAADIAAQGVFASLSGGSFELWWGAHPALFQELARQQVITIAVGAKSQMLTDMVLFDELHPYLWSVLPSTEDQVRNATDFICTSMAGKPARHAGAALQGTTRKIGVIAADQYGVPSSKAVKGTLSACGIEPEVVTLQGATSAVTRTALQSFKDDGVTTILCVCAQGTFSSYVGTSNNSLGYWPEWVPVGFGELEEFLGNFFSSEVLSHMLFVTPQAKSLPPQARPSFGALQEAIAGSINLLDSSVVFDAMYYGSTAYSQLMVLASGLQMAGPQLTPDTFAAALTATEFPNAGAGTAPYWQQAVGFGPGDHAFYDDYALAWWSPTATVDNPASPAGRGFWCYIDAGSRYSVGRYPADADSRFFSPSEPCR